jgi:hypothetical protein
MSTRRNTRDRSAFKKAFAWTAVPIVALSVLSTVGSGVEGLYAFWYVAAGLWLLSVLVGIGFAIGRGGQTTSGIWAGVGLGVVALGLTCFANLSTFEI